MYSIRSKVQSIYLGIILLDKQIELNNVLVSNLSRNQKEVQTLVDGGMAGPSDLDQIRVNILTCEQQQAALETDRKAYLRMLGLLTGQDMTGLTLVEPEPESNLAMEIKRPELALYDAQAVQLQAQKDQLNTSLWPRLNLNLQAGYGRPGLNMLSGSFDPYFVAGVRLQWDFGKLVIIIIGIIIKIKRTFRRLFYRMIFYVLISTHHAFQQFLRSVWFTNYIIRYFGNCMFVFLKVGVTFKISSFFIKIICYIIFGKEDSFKCNIESDGTIKLS